MPLFDISWGTVLGVGAILTPLSLSAPRLQTRAATVPLFPWLSVTSLSPHCHCPVSVTQPAPRGGGVGLYRAVLLSDSRSVLEKLEDSKGEERQYLAKCLGNVVRNTESLVLQWIPALCRIEGNERAVRLAKEGRVLEQIESDLTYR